ncbi:MAG TPA: PEP-CTERM sorting domain-containing protein [Terriglobales bacterium]
MKLKAVGIILVATILVAPAFANAVFTLGNHPQPNEQNILFTSFQSGATVNGFTNFTNTLVQFSSTTDTLVVTAVGQAKVTAMDGLVNDITISVPGTTFEDFILNPFNPAANNDLTITVTMSDASVFTFGPYGSINGNNFLTITTSGGELISSVTVDSVGGFDDLRQPRISGITGASVPEPSSLLLLGSGALGILGVLRRKLIG